MTLRDRGWNVHSGERPLEEWFEVGPIKIGRLDVVALGLSSEEEAGLGFVIDARK